MVLPVPVSLRIHHALKRIKRDVEFFYQFFNENDLYISFMPARYFALTPKANELHSGFYAIRNIKMYTVYSAPAWKSDAEFSRLPAVYELLETSETIPTVIYYTCDS
jgi:hypothetical protein